jgi:hypothetical protein
MTDYAKNFANALANVNASAKGQFKVTGYQFNPPNSIVVKINVLEPEATDLGATPESWVKAYSAVSTCIENIFGAGKLKHVIDDVSPVEPYGACLKVLYESNM